MSGPIVIVPKYAKIGEGFSRKEKVMAMAHPGRQQHSAASWITDLLSLRRIIILCSFCRAKFNPRRDGPNYRRVYIPDETGKTDGYTVNGTCDSCKQWTANCGGGTAFQPEEVYALTHVDPIEAKRKARAAARILSLGHFAHR